MDVVAAGRRLHPNAIITRGMDTPLLPFVFAGSECIAADFAFGFLAAQMRDIERLAKASGGMVVTK